MRVRADIELETNYLCVATLIKQKLFKMEGEQMFLPDHMPAHELEEEPQAELTAEQLLQHIRNLTNTQQHLINTINQMKRRAEDPFLQFKTPDPIKNLATFSGNKKETQAWVDDTQSTLDLFENYKDTPTYAQIIRAVKNKITDQAKEILIAAGNPNDWDEIKEVLLNAYGDRRDLTSHIQSLFYIKQGNKTLSEYFNKIKSIDTAIKATASNMEEYKDSTRAINKLISLITLTRFVDGLGEQLSMHVRSYRPDTVEEAYNITMQYSNAAYRQKLDRKSNTDYDLQKDKRSNQKQYQQPKINNNTNPNTSSPFNKSFNQNSNQSGNFKNRNQKQLIDEDVSMRTARSKTQVNTHVSKTANEEENDEPEYDATSHPDNSALESDDDAFFVGEELNFLLARRSERET